MSRMAREPFFPFHHIASRLPRVLSPWPSIRAFSPSHFSVRPSSTCQVRLMSDETYLPRCVFVYYAISSLSSTTHFMVAIKCVLFCAMFEKWPCSGDPHLTCHQE